MKREAKRLLANALDFLVLSIEHFNRPSNTGRTTAVLVFLDHSLEMLLKAAIVERGGDIDNKDHPGQKIGFDTCVGRGLSDGEIQFLSDDQAKLLRMINGERDAAQHYLNGITEQLLYLQAQSGVSVFREILRKVFKLELSSLLPARALPISTLPPVDLHMIFDREIESIKQMLTPGSRKRVDVEAHLRSLIIIDKALLGGNVQQPNRRETNIRRKGLSGGLDWREVFPNVASLSVEAGEGGHVINLVTRKKGEGLPIKIAEEASSEAQDAAVMLQTINEFDRYSMNSL